MKIQWTSHLTDETDKERFKNKVISAKSVLKRELELIEAREQAINSIETGIEIYKQPGWEGLLSHYNGEKAALKYIKNLITLDQGD